MSYHPGCSMVEKPAVGDCGEFILIDRIRKLLPPVSGSVRLGIGDDAAVIRQPGGEALLVTTDMLVEGIHFDCSFISAADLGGKALAVNLSDIAAMGGIPTGCFLGLGLPPSLSLAWFTDFIAGMMDTAGHYGVQLLGGDTVASEQITIAITMHGRAAEVEIVYREGAKPGDRIYVSGTLGDSALGLHLLQQGKTADMDKKPAESFLINRHRRPQPRIQLAHRLAETSLASSMLDVSDGLLGDLGHLLVAGGRLGAEIILDHLPLSPAYRQLQSLGLLDGYLPALTGGEDYELLFTVAAEREDELAGITMDSGVDVRCVGRIEEKAGIRLKLPGGQLFSADDLHGYDHFSVHNVS
ncbi:MAG: thiamine-phosphate kinase [Pseudomonadota bacterium]|nr:thiamine-phosphate kinase [Pseudomonadota bacterium]